MAPEPNTAHLDPPTDLSQLTADETAWQSIADLKARAGRDRNGTDKTLNEMFRAGAVPKGLSGPTHGVLVMTTTNPLLDPVVRLVTSLWMPWQGKRFDSESETGINQFTDSATVPAKLLWPSYRTQDAEQGKLAFDFITYEDSGRDDPDRQVLVIDYSKVEANPRLIIKRIRDELVQVAPTVYLGKVLFQLPSLPDLPGMDSLHKRVKLIPDLSSERFARVGYFALRTGT
jgi:hypothetical protein